MLLDKGPRVASASWPAYGDVQPFTGAAKLSGFLVFVIKYVRFYSIDTIYEKN